MRGSPPRCRARSGRHDRGKSRRQREAGGRLALQSASLNPCCLTSLYIGRRAMLAQVVLRSEQMTSATDLRNPQSAQAPSVQPERIGAATAAISFQDVSKQFAGADGSPLEVLRGVSFDLPVG